MTDRTMRHALLLVALTCGIGSLTPRAEAQAISSNATIYIDGEKVTNASNVYISRAKCSGTWRFELQGYSTAVPYLEMWATNSTSTNCADQANRSSANNTNPVCWQVTSYQNAVRGKTTFIVDGNAIFNSTRANPAACDDGIRGTKYKVQFVTLESSTLTNTATVAASNNNPNQISAILTLYSKVPTAPTNASAIGGGRTLGISYDKIDNDPLTQYRAVFDHDPQAPIFPPELDAGTSMDAGAVTCGTGKFDSTTTADPDSGATGTGPKTGSEIAIDNSVTFQSGKTKGKSVSIGNLDAKNIPFNTYTAVAVYAIDGAGNLGQLSTRVCAKREETIGYLGACQDGGLDCGELDSCSLSPRNAGSAFWLSACTLALSALARRRRRSN